MNRYLKIVIIGILSVVTLLTLGSGIVSYFFQDEVINFVLESVNKQVTSRIQVRSAGFSVFRRFPNAAVEFRDVAISPASDFDTLSFAPAYSRQLLSAENVFVELNLFRLLTGDYRINKIEVRDGNINMLTDKNGRHNFIFWKSTGKTGGDSSPIELQNVTLRNVDVYYSHKRSNTVILLHADHSQLSGRFTSRQYSLATDWQGNVQHFSVGGDVYIRNKALELSGKLDADNNVFTIRRSNLTLAKVQMTVSGGFSTGDEVDLDLHFEGNQLDYTSAVSLIPEPYNKQMADYPGKGEVSFSASVKGKAGDGAIPNVEAKFGMVNGQITHRQSKIKLGGLSFNGSFSSGDNNRRATSSLRIRDFGCSLGGGTVKGSLLVQNFVRPQITVKASGNIDLGQMYRFFPLKQLTAAGGRARGDITVNARFKRLVPAKADDIEQLDLQGTLKLNDALVYLAAPSYRIDHINGTLQLGSRITTKDFSMTLNGNDFKIDGYMERLGPYLMKRSRTLFLNANVTSQRLCVDSLLQTSTAMTGKGTAATNGTTDAAPLLPDNIDFDTNLEVAKFSYRKFETTRLKAHLTYQPKVLAIRSVNFASMSGKVSGSGTIANDEANNILVLGETMLAGIDIGQLFRTFDNFGQDVLRAEHVKGQLSGDVGFAVGWDSKMRLRQDDIAVEGRMDLDGGELVNFEPLHNLSRFVALEELQNVRFSSLKTRVAIRNRKLTFPQTDIKTSAFDILGSGEHYFDNSYTYRIKILLSELLAAKARKAKRENQENEYSEDGGKRTALYLKIIGQGSDFNISYDKQSARASVATDIRNEKQNLKGILRDEFGWFKKDSLTKPPAPSNNANTGKLRFTFDDEPQQEKPATKDKKKKQQKQENEEKIKVEWE